MKRILVFLFALLVLPSMMAISLEVEKESSGEVLIIGLDEPVVFDLKITNLGPSDSFQFYNLLGFDVFPKGTVYISNKETENVELKLKPIGEFKSRGFYNFKYYIRGSGADQTEELAFNIIDLKDVFEITTDKINPESTSVKVNVRNKVKHKFDDINTKVTSEFFDFDKKFSLDENGNATFNVELEKKDFEKLTAGFYTLRAEMDIDGKETVVEGTIEFSEKNIVSASATDYGWVISTEVIEKANTGNMIEKSETVVKKNIFSRLFTSFEPAPDSVERKGFAIYYTWSRNISPGETLRIVVKTNWFYPLLIIIFIVVIVVLVKKYSMTSLGLRKKVSFVRAKGGEFALKVSISVHAKRYLERVKIVDRMPALTKVYERFGMTQPTGIDQRNRRMEWDFERMQAGETRVISYIIYSKIGVLGRFALPPATGFYEVDGEVKEAVSNRVFFVTEQRGERVERNIDYGV